MSKKTKTTKANNTANVTTKPLTKKEQELKKNIDASYDTLNEIMGSMDGVYEEPVKLVKATDLYDQVKGPNSTIEIPLLQRDELSSNQNFANEIGTGVVQGTSGTVSCITIAVLNGVMYLLDGLQRLSMFYALLTSQLGFFVLKQNQQVKGNLKFYYSLPAIHKSNELELTPEAKQRFENFHFAVKIVHCQTEKQMKEYFMKINCTNPMTTEQKTNVWTDLYLSSKVKEIYETLKDGFKSYFPTRLRSSVFSDKGKQKYLIQEFLVECIHVAEFVNEKQEERPKGRITDYVARESMYVNQADVDAGVKLFYKAWDIMKEVRLGSKSQKIANYRVLWLLVLDIIQHDNQRFFYADHMLLNHFIKLGEIFPHTMEGSADLSKIHRKEMAFYADLDKNYIEAEKQKLLNAIANPNSNQIA